MSADKNKDQLLPSKKIQVQVITAKRVLRLLPNQTFNSSLGDYTQWVHLACPHWFDVSIDLVRPPAKKPTVILRPQPTARSRLRSRGLNPVGALSVPPLVPIPLDMVRLD